MKKKPVQNINRLCSQAETLIREGRIAEAESLCRSTLQSAPGNVAIRHMMALICLERGDCREAGAHALAGLNTDARNEQLLLLLAEALRLNGEFEESIQTLRRLLAINPRQDYALNNLGGLLIEQGQYHEAIEILERLCRAGQGGASAENNLGTALSATGHHDQALGHFEKAAGLAPGFFEAHINRANTLSECGRIDEARKAYDHCISTFPDRVETYRRFGDMYYRIGRAQDAVTQYSRGLQLAPEEVDIHLNIGRALHDMGQTLEARNHLSQAAAAAPGRADVAIALASILADMKDTAGAKASAMKALGLIAPNSELVCQLAEVLVAIEAKTEAERLLRNYADLDPADKDRALLLLAGLGGEPLPAQTPAGFVRQRYAAMATNWDALEDNPPATLVAHRLMDLIGDSRTATVLDLGCGTGRIGELVAGHVEAIDGIDISPEMLDKAKAKNVYRHLWQGDLIDLLQFSKTRYEVIVAAASLIYISDLARTLELGFELLASEGFLIFTALAAANTEAPVFANFYGRTVEGCFSHSPEYLHRAASNAGYRVVGIDPVTHELDRLKRPIPGLLVTLRRPPLG